MVGSTCHQDSTQISAGGLPGALQRSCTTSMPKGSNSMFLSETCVLTMVARFYTPRTKTQVARATDSITNWSVDRVCAIWPPWSWSLLFLSLRSRDIVTFRYSIVAVNGVPPYELCGTRKTDAARTGVRRRSRTSGAGCLVV
jgi:hypothetical protein